MNPGEQDVLLVVDVQNDFCPGGALAVRQGDEIVPAVNRLAAEFAHVILTQDWHPRGHASFATSHPAKQPFNVIEASYGEQILWPEHCVQGTEGASFHPALHVPHAELVLRKGFRPGSTPTRLSRKTTAARRLGSPVISRNAASNA